MPLRSLETSAVALTTKGVSLLVTGENLWPAGTGSPIQLLLALAEAGVLRLGWRLDFLCPYALCRRLSQQGPQQSMAWVPSMYINNSLMFESFWGWRRINTPVLCLMVHLSMFQISQMINISLTLNGLYFSTYSHNTYTIINQISLTDKLNFPSHFPTDGKLFNFLNIYHILNPILKQIHYIRLP